MKTTFLIIAIIGCVALGIFGFEESKKLQAQNAALTSLNADLAATKQQVESLEAELRDKEADIENARMTEAKLKTLQHTLSESATVAAARSKKTEQLEESLSQAKTNNPMSAMAKMFKDPSMREMLKSQQKATLGPMITAQYGDLFKQLNLTPEQSAAFKDLVMNKMMAGTDAGLAMMDDSMDASQRAELQKQIKAQTDDMDAQIKQFLGDSNYSTYQTYEKTVPDRMTMSQFNNQFSGSPTALSADQQSQMVQALSDARNNFNWTSGLNQQNPTASGDLAHLLTDDNIAKFTAEREQFDQGLLPKIQPILTPEQYTAYQAFQKQQRDLQLMGLNMAKQMFSSQSH